MSARDTLMDEFHTAQLVEKDEAALYHIRSEFQEVEVDGQGVRHYTYPSEDTCREIIRLREIEAAALELAKQRRVNEYRMNKLRATLGLPAIVAATIKAKRNGSVITDTFTLPIPFPEPTTPTENNR